MADLLEAVRALPDDAETAGVVRQVGDVCFLEWVDGHLVHVEVADAGREGLAEAWRAQSEGAGARVVVLIDTSLGTP